MENSVVVKEKNNKGLIILIIILVFAILGLCTYIICNNSCKCNNEVKENSNDKVNISNSNNETNDGNESTIENNKLTEDEIIEKLFIAVYLNDPSTNEKLQDYKIDSIKKLPDSEIEPLGYSKEDILVSISYDVKPVNENSTWWIAGNGENGDNGWIINKSACVVIKQDIYGNYYIQSIGTGW